MNIDQNREQNINENTDQKIEHIAHQTQQKNTEGATHVMATHSRKFNTLTKIIIVRLIKNFEFMNNKSTKVNLTLVQKGTSNFILEYVLGAR